MREDGNDVRFEAHYGLKSDIAACPKSANFGSGHAHSITSSARASSVGGMWMPKDRAVAELITNLNSVGC
jgi:hypothetical protein